MSASVASKNSLDTTLNRSSDLETFSKKYKENATEPDYLETSSGYFTSTAGAFRLFQFIKKFCAFPILYAKGLKLSSKTITKLATTQNKFKTAERLLIVPKMFFDAKCLNDSYKDYKNEDKKHQTRTWDKAAKKIVETVADCSIFLQLGEMLGIYTLGAIIGPAASFSGSLFLLFQHVFCLKMEREDFIFHKNLYAKENDNIKSNERLTTIFHENKNLDLIKLTKSIISIALSVFLLTEFVFSVSILAPQTLLFLSTATTVLAIWSHFYKESMTYRLN